MKGCILSVFSLLVTLFSLGQEYWQQEVNYVISVSLDDRNHVLRGFEEFEYVNNSPDELSFIYVHLWPNAYKNGKTALAKQLYHEGNDYLKFGADSLKGYIDSLDFRSKGEKLNWSYDPKHIDIAKLELKQALKPGERIKISTPIKVKIPSGQISRLGHIEQSYQITQWYPKPAVYDKDGWHQMPYLNQGEFYSEFGSFDVSISLPENYVVGATGDLQTQSELAFLNKKADETAQKIAALTHDKRKSGEPTPFPPSSENSKTLRYKQSNVHDFAWFADKRYDVLKGEVELPNTGKKVTTWAMFVPQNINLWKDAIEYINDGAYYYSKWNGDYPYNQITAVDGTISAGGGMEYPNVTVIGNASSALMLEVVIVHEVGHNWFYGILGSNERVHGWMDEGLNTLNEVRYIMTKYPDNTYLADMILNGAFNFHGLHYHDYNDILFRSVQYLGLGQPIETHSAEFKGINYGVIMYQKTGLVFDYLRYYLGDEKFDKAMHTYYEEFEFKHPQPEDLQRVFENVTGENLDWLFEALIKTTDNIDFRLGRIKHTLDGTVVRVRNKGSVKSPIPVSAMEDDSIVETIWVGACQNKQEITFDEQFDKIMIDPLRKIPETNRQNNLWQRYSLINKIEPIHINGLTAYNRGEETNVHYIPALGWNTYDKFMLGVGIHNFSLVPNPFNYMVIPMYSFGRNGVSGIGELSYKFFPRKIKTASVGLSLKSFKDDDSFERNSSFFAVASPYLRLDFANSSKRHAFQHMVILQGLAKNTRRGELDVQEYGGFAEWKTIYNKADHGMNTSLRTDFIHNDNSGDQAGRIFGSVEYSYKYLKKKWQSNLELRLFGSYNYLFEVNNLSAAYRYGVPLTGNSGYQDVFVEEYFLNRGGNSGFMYTQRMENMGGFLSSSDFGFASSWMTTANLYVEIPLPKPVNIFGIFGDVGTFEQQGTVYTAYNAGVGIRLGDFFGLYYPLVASENLTDGYPGNSFTDKLRVTLKLNPVNKGFFKKILN
ncbi:MAG: M1 family metallopeptidase [Brumimicrobium sp.]|nr:M1 family metallopeptidase [Brumimicrobium sp.]